MLNFELNSGGSALACMQEIGVRSPVASDSNIVETDRDSSTAKRRK